MSSGSSLVCCSLNLILAMVDVLVSFTPFWFCCLKGFGFMRELNVERRMTQIGLSISCVFKANVNKK